LIGLEIFASQKKIDEFTDLYNKLVNARTSWGSKRRIEAQPIGMWDHSQISYALR
jgi:hypothetical protein